MTDFDDAMFEQYAEAQENKSSKTPNTTRDYEDIAWTGCEQGIPKIVRVIGGAPDSNIDDFTAKTVNIAWIVDDSGKRFKLIRPSIDVDGNYIINKIISRVMAPKWVNKVKTFPVQERFPEIYNIVKRNGLADGDKQAKFDKGWMGKEVLIMNVIDRSKMDWHRENKHTMLLAKSVTEGRDGGSFVDEGISSYAVNNRLAHLFKSYGSWKRYDLAFTRTGKMDTPYVIVNATRTPEEVPSSYRSFISDANTLTDEEMSWEAYNLNKLYKVTSPIKIYNKLKGTIARIDAALGTSFLKDLEREVEEEKRKLAESQPQSYTSPTGEMETNPEAATALRTRPVVGKGESNDRERLPYESTLGELASKIKKVTHKTGNTYDVEWDMPVEQLAACPYCQTASPLEATSCPACGNSFQ